MTPKIGTTYDLGGGARIVVNGWVWHGDLPGGLYIERPGSAIVEGDARQWLEFCDAVMMDRGVGVSFKRMAIYRDGGEFVMWSPRNTHESDPEIRVAVDKMREAAPFILGALAAFQAIANERAEQATP